VLEMIPFRVVIWIRSWVVVETWLRHSMKPKPPKTVGGGFAATVTDSVIGNPYIHFMISEIWAGLAGVMIYAIFRGGAYATQYVTELLPLHTKAPALFLELTLSWGASISASATFIIISLYQLAVLVKRLWGGLNYGA
jgi:hypothetical protein